jgi:Xaa-Pro aminopeptidase
MKHQKIESIREVQYAVEQAMHAVIEYLKNTDKPTSKEAHQTIDQVLERYGCESPEGHIVASGIQAVDPHEEGFGDIDKNVPIVIDIYPRSKKTSYYADMTRTVCLGKAKEKTKKMYSHVLEAQKLAIGVLREGVKCIEIQKVVEDFFAQKGYETRGKGKEFEFEEGFVHGVGHGVSKILHDSPPIGRKTKDVLKAGDVVTIEPGLYYYDIGGIRIEDMFLVTEDGYEHITSFPTDFEIV